MDINVKQSVTLKQVSNLLCTAFEGGCNYWYCELKRGTKPRHERCPWDDDDTEFFHIWWPLDGGSLLFKDAEEEDAQYELTYDKIEKGLNIMAARYPRHWADFISENDDAITGDVFLQCCVFGEVVYG